LRVESKKGGRPGYVDKRDVERCKIAKENLEIDPPAILARQIKITLVF